MKQSFIQEELPKISIVTPTYNQGRFIEQTICSVLDQGYPNLEYIIIDGGSTDNTVDIIKKYEHRLSYWVSEMDSGQTHAINKGFAKCTGEIFNWINSDDYYAPDALQKIAKAFADEDISCVCGKEYGFVDKEPDNLIQHHGSVIKANVFDTLAIGIIDQPCTFFRKKIIVPFFPLNESFRYVMDKELWMKYLLSEGQDNIKQIDNVLTYFRLHSNSKSILEGDKFKNEITMIRHSLLQAVKAPDILQQAFRINPVAEIDWDIKIKPVKEIHAVFAFSLATNAYINGDIKKASVFMQIVRKARLTKERLRLWVLVDLLPLKILKLLKRFKRK